MNFLCLRALLFSKRGVWAGSLNVAWDFVKNTESQGSLQAPFVGIRNCQDPQVIHSVHSGLKTTLLMLPPWQKHLQRQPLFLGPLPSLPTREIAGMS